jgi:hypothetical protein
MTVPFNGTVEEELDKNQFDKKRRRRRKSRRKGETRKDEREVLYSFPETFVRQQRRR